MRSTSAPGLPDATPWGYCVTCLIPVVLTVASYMGGLNYTSQGILTNL
jgi:hypothetical protein